MFGCYYYLHCLLFLHYACLLFIFCTTTPERIPCMCKHILGNKQDSDSDSPFAKRPGSTHAYAAWWSPLTTQEDHTQSRNHPTLHSYCFPVFFTYKFVERHQLTFGPRQHYPSLSGTSVLWSRPHAASIRFSHAGPAFPRAVGTSFNLTQQLSSVNPFPRLPAPSVFITSPARHAVSGSALAVPQKEGIGQSVGKAWDSVTAFSLLCSTVE